MRLICPNCTVTYNVSEDIIPQEGRDVKCSNCSHIWFKDGIFILSKEFRNDKNNKVSNQPLDKSPNATFHSERVKASFFEGKKDDDEDDEKNEPVFMSTHSGEPKEDVELDSLKTETSVLEILRAEAAYAKGSIVTSGLIKDTLSESLNPPPKYDTKEDLEISDMARFFHDLKEEKKPVSKKVKISQKTASLAVSSDVENNDDDEALKSAVGEWMNNAEKEVPAIQDEIVSPEMHSKPKKIYKSSVEAETLVKDRTDDEVRPPPVLNNVEVSQDEMNERIKSIISPINDDKKNNQNTFWNGFLMASFLILFAIIVYLFTPWISKQLPSSKPYLNSYSEKVDHGRNKLKNFFIK